MLGEIKLVSLLSERPS